MECLHGLNKTQLSGKQALACLEWEELGQLHVTRIAERIQEQNCLAASSREGSCSSYVKESPRGNPGGETLRVKTGR